MLTLVLKCSFEGMQGRRAPFEHHGFENLWHVVVLFQQTYLLIRNGFLSHKLALFLGWNA